MPRCQVLDMYFYDLDIKTICRHTTWYLDIMYCIYAVRYVEAYKNIWMMHQIADSTSKTMATTFTCIERKLSDQYLCHQALLPLTAEQEHPDVSWCSLPLVPWYGGPGNTNEGHQGSNFSGVPSHSKNMCWEKIICYKGISKTGNFSMLKYSGDESSWPFHQKMSHSSHPNIILSWQNTHIGLMTEWDEMWFVITSSGHEMWFVILSNILQTPTRCSLEISSLISQQGYLQKHATNNTLSLQNNIFLLPCKRHSPRFSITQTKPQNFPTVCTCFIHLCQLLQRSVRTKHCVFSSGTRFSHTEWGVGTGAAHGWGLKDLIRLSLENREKMDLDPFDKDHNAFSSSNSSKYGISNHPMLQHFMRKCTSIWWEVKLARICPDTVSKECWLDKVEI